MPAASPMLGADLPVRGSSLRMRKSPWPEVCETIAPEGKIRGPAACPSSIARLSANAGPPTSRTVVNPRSRVRSASFAATRGT